ncbi:unnamed protein product [Closterium sp. Naga37s-1]|nr:unnamed protein product [Closterium sp. Naga37s-1]
MTLLEESAKLRDRATVTTTAADRAGSGHVAADMTADASADVARKNAHHERASSGVPPIASAISSAAVGAVSASGASASSASANNVSAISASASSAATTPELRQPSGSASGSDTPKLKQWVAAHPPAHGLDKSALVVDGSALSYLWKEVVGRDGAAKEGGKGADVRREKVYNTMFNVPWRCELLIIMGYLVCLDSFLSLLAILPIRLFLLLLRLLLAPWRGRLHLGVDDIADVGKGVIIVCGVLALQQADVSLIYHWIRGQNILKLVVVYNVLEVMDKLCQSLGCDVLQMTLNTAARVAAAATAGSEAGPDRAECFLLHALVLLTQAVTLNVAINSHNHILVTLLVSNNFAEVKSNVFKRFSRENIHKLACLDTVERFHLSCHLLFVVVQNVVKGQGTSLSFFIRCMCVRCYAVQRMSGRCSAEQCMCERCGAVLKDRCHHVLAPCKPHSPPTSPHHPPLVPPPPPTSPHLPPPPPTCSPPTTPLLPQVLEDRCHHVHRSMSFVPLGPAINVSWGGHRGGGGCGAVTMGTL